MQMYRQRRWGVALIAGFVACGVYGIAPIEAQSVPIIVPPMSPIVVGITPGIPSLVVEGSGSSRAGVTWSTSGRADMDVDVDRQHGLASAR